MVNITIAVYMEIFIIIRSRDQVYAMTSIEQVKVKTTWLLPKTLIKQLKQYALDNETTSTAVVIEACNEYLSKRKKAKEK
jgi:hypothetical protein